MFVIASVWWWGRRRVRAGERDDTPAPPVLVFCWECWQRKLAAEKQEGPPERAFLLQWPATTGIWVRSVTD